jgi:hypothetical protein
MERPAILTGITPTNRARELLSAVNAASHAAQTGWLVLLLLTAYYIVALGGVSDRDLLLNAPIALPLLGISVSLDQFFLYAPPVFIIVHLGVLLQNAILVRKVYAFLALVDAQELAESASTGKPSVHPLRYELHSNFFTQYLAGPPQSPMLSIFMQVVVWGSLVLLPVGVLIAFQIAFLPYHDVTTTWAHRIYVLADIIIIALIGVFLPSKEQGFWQALGSGIVTYPLFYLITTMAFMALFVLSFALATVPGEWIDRKLAANGPARDLPLHGESGGTRQVFAPTAWLFEGGVNPATGRATSLFHRNLIVMDEDLSATDGRAAALRFRDLRYARFDRSDFRGADLTCADVTGAVFEGARMDGAKTGCPVDAAPARDARG